MRPSFRSFRRVDRLAVPCRSSETTSSSWFCPWKSTQVFMILSRWHVTSAAQSSRIFLDPRWGDVASEAASYVSGVSFCPCKAVQASITPSRWHVFSAAQSSRIFRHHAALWCGLCPPGTPKSPTVSQKSFSGPPRSHYQNRIEIHRNSRSLYGASSSTASIGSG